MAKIIWMEKPTAPCNQVLFQRLSNPEARFRYLCKAVTVHDTRRLKSLVYAAFRSTLYWIIVREYAIWRSGGKCSNSACGSTDNPNVHHRNYAFQGEEHRAMDCLTVLCESCHSAGHHFKSARTTAEKLDAISERLTRSHVTARPTSRINRNYDPRTMMNLKMYGDVRGYQGGDNGETA